MASTTIWRRHLWSSLPRGGLTAGTLTLIARSYGYGRTLPSSLPPPPPPPPPPRSETPRFLRNETESVAIPKLKAVLAQLDMASPADLFFGNCASTVADMTDEDLLQRARFLLSGIGVSAEFLCSCPSLLLAADMLEEELSPVAVKCFRLLSKGERESVVSVVARAPSELKEGFMAAKVEVLRYHVGFSEAEVVAVMREMMVGGNGQPRLFLDFLRMPVERLVWSLRYLQSFRCSTRRSLLDLLRRCPAICLLTDAELKTRIQEKLAITREMMVEGNGWPRLFLDLLRMAMECLAWTLRCLQSFQCSTQCTLLDLLCHCPTICLLTDAELKTRIQVLSRVSKAPMQMAARHPWVLLRDMQGLEETLSYWQSLSLSDGMRQDLISGRLGQNPDLLIHSKQEIQSVVELLVESIGVPKKEALSFLLRRPTLIGYGAKHLASCVAMLQSDGLDNVAIRALFSNRTPSKLFLVRTPELRRRLKSLPEHGITKNELITARPEILTLGGAKKMQRKSKFLEHTLGIKNETPEHAVALKSVLASKNADLESQINYLIALGFNREQALQMAKSLPAILTISKGALSKRVRFLLRVMKRPVKEIVPCPEFFFCSMKNTLLPRHRVLSWLQSTGSLKETIPISTIVRMEEDTFLKEFVDGSHAQTLAIYKGVQTEAIESSEEKE